MKCTAEEVIQYVEEENVKFIRLAFCDVYGQQKNLSIMPGELRRAFSQGMAFDASAIAGFGGAVRSDLFLRPDPATLAGLPWRPENGRVVRMFCDITRPDGSVFEADTRHLLPDGYETAKATEILAREGFTVLPYINPDLYVARACADAGAAAVMPLGAPIGTNRGLRTREMIGILIEEIDLPIVVDAGIGLPSHACEAMEMGAAACLVNTGIASSTDPVLMGRAFRQAVEAGRAAWLAGPGAVRASGEGAQASSPLTGFLR